MDFAKSPIWPITPRSGAAAHVKDNGSPRTTPAHIPAAIAPTRPPTAPSKVLLGLTGVSFRFPTERPTK